MILTVSHVTTYSYDQPMLSAAQSLRVFPSRFDGQRVIDWSVRIEGGTRGASFRDGAGDKIESWTLRGPLEAVIVRVQGQVETCDLAGVLQGHRETIAPEVYLRDTPPTEADQALRDLARSAAGTTGALDAAHRMAGAVAEAIAYRPGVTHAHTTAAEALALGEGVCQDHAHALIAMARSVDMPARYVSGYLFASEDGTPHEAAHAWAEIFIGGLGWVGFDPANRCCPDARYIRLGSGLDAQGAAPIRGVARGAGSESLDVTVALAAAQQ